MQLRFWRRCKTSGTTNPQVGAIDKALEAAAILRSLRTKIANSELFFLGGYSKISKTPLRKMSWKMVYWYEKPTDKNSKRQLLAPTNWSCIDSKWLPENLRNPANNDGKGCESNYIIRETWLVKLFGSWSGWVYAWFCFHHRNI